MFKNFIFLVTLMVYILLLSCANEMSLADEPLETMQAELTADAHWEIDEGQNTRVGTMQLNAATTLELDRTKSGLDHKPLLTTLALQYTGKTFKGTLSFRETLTQNVTDSLIMSFS